MTSRIVRLGLELALPSGWCEHALDTPGIVELRPRADGDTGLLQVSQLAGDAARLLAETDDLAAATAVIGANLPGFGPSAGARAERCVLGCMAVSVHAQGEYPSLLVMITVGAGNAHLWTWIGPDPQADELREAVAIVHDARPATDA